MPQRGPRRINSAPRKRIKDHYCPVNTRIDSVGVNSELIVAENQRREIREVPLDAYVDRRAPTRRHVSFHALIFFLQNITGAWTAPAGVLHTILKAVGLAGIHAAAHNVAPGAINYDLK